MSECSIPDIKQQNLVLNSFIDKNNTDYGKYNYLLQQTQTINRINFYLIWVFLRF